MSTTDTRRSRGRPRATDPRRKRAVLWTDAEWAEVRRLAAAAGLRVGEFVRRAVLGENR